MQYLFQENIYKKTFSFVVYSLLSEYLKKVFEFLIFFYISRNNILLNTKDNKYFIIDCIIMRWEYIIK